MKSLTSGEIKEKYDAVILFEKVGEYHYYYSNPWLKPEYEFNDLRFYTGDNNVSIGSYSYLDFDMFDYGTLNISIRLRGAQDYKDPIRKKPVSKKSVDRFIQWFEQNKSIITGGKLLIIKA